MQCDKVASSKYYIFCVKSKFVPYICPARHVFSLISVLPPVKSHWSRIMLLITLTSDKFWLAVIGWRHTLSSLSARIEKLLVEAGNLSGCVWTWCNSAAQYRKQSKGSSAHIILPSSVENCNFLLLSTETLLHFSWRSAFILSLSGLSKIKFSGIECKSSDSFSQTPHHCHFLSSGFILKAMQYACRSVHSQM